MQINNISDPPKKQDSVTELKEKFAHLRRLCEDLQNAVLRWIVIREATIQKLKSLVVHLKDVESEVHSRQYRLVATLTGLASVSVYCIPIMGQLLAVASIIAMIGKTEFEEILRSLGLSEVQALIEEDRKCCLELQQQFNSLENFISTLAEFLIPLNDNVVLLKEMVESSFEFLYKYIACEDIDTSTVTKVGFCAKFLRAATSAGTMSSSISDAQSATVFVSEVARVVAMARSESKCEAVRTGTLAKYIADSCSSDIKSYLFPLEIALFLLSSFKDYCGSVSLMAEDIRGILNELECPNEEEIQCLVQSLIEGSFNKAYRMVESDSQREYRSDEVVEADDH